MITTSYLLFSLIPGQWAGPMSQKNADWKPKKELELLAFSSSQYGHFLQVTEFGWILFDEIGTIYYYLW